MYKIIFLTLGLGVLAIFSKNWPAFYEQVFAKSFVWILIFQSALSLVIHFFGMRALKKDKSAAFQFYLGGSLARLLFSLSGLGAYLLLLKMSKEEIILSVFNFLIIYLLFAALEIRAFLYNLRANS